MIRKIAMWPLLLAAVPSMGADLNDAALLDFVSSEPHGRQGGNVQDQQRELADLTQQADAHFEQGRYAAAAEIYAKVVAAAPDDSAVRRRMLESRVRAGMAADEDRRMLDLLDQEEAVKERIAKDSIELDLTRATVALERKDYERASELARDGLLRTGDLQPGPDRDALAARFREVLLLASDPSLRERLVSGEPLPAERADDMDHLSQPSLRSLRRTYAGMRDSQGRELERLRQAQIIPNGIMTYPLDWAARLQKRARFTSGMVARGPEFRDTDGKMRYTAIYDVRDLLFPIPDYGDAPNLSLADQTRNLLDREALRRYSRIFNGYPEDLYFGIPLLQYSGGIEESHITPRTSEQEREDLLRLIESYVKE